MIRLVQRKLIIPRGDTGTFSVPVISTLNTGDVAVFTIIDMKTKRKVYEKIIDATPDTISIRFEHRDTVNLPVGRYYWDIKFYQNPEWADNELINGTEVDSYYAAYSLPECEIRLTGDNLLTADDSPTTTITPYYLNVLNATVNDVNHAKTEITELANSANEAATRAQEQADSIKQLSAIVTMLGTNDEPTSVYNSETGVLALGIPAPNSIFGILKTSEDGLVDTYTISYTNGTSTTFTVTNGMIPNLTIGIVQEGATAAASITGTAANPILNLTLPNANVPTKVSELENDAGYLTEHQDLSNYVQKTDYATNTTPGIVKVAGLGVKMSNDEIVLAPASNGQMKRGSGDTAPIVAAQQHQSTFYGLAKAAGDTTQSQSANTVGTYTDEAKTAIQTMLDVPSNADVAAKQDALTFDSAPTANSTNPVTSGGVYSAIANVNTMKLHICAQAEYDAETGIPTIQNPDTQTFYLVPGGEGNNLFIEWAYVNGAWERFGSADVDLSGYATKADTVLETTLSRGRKAGTTVGIGSVAFGGNVEASGNQSHAEGSSSIASGTASHAEGMQSIASGNYSHAEGRQTNANGAQSHAEGRETIANAIGSHTEGYGTIANARYSHISGKYNIEDSYTAWPEWVANTSYAVGDKVKVTVTADNATTVTGYICKTDNSDAEFTVTNWTKDLEMNFAEIIGNGTADDARSNAYVLDWDGNGHYAGDVYVHANADSSGGTKLASVNDIPEVPVTDVQVNGVSVLSDGVANVPLGSSQVYGVLMAQHGLMTYQGKISISTPTDAQFRQGNLSNMASVLSKQHMSAFYGLAKAAGADMKDIANTTVGTYPDAQKEAIQSMLGITQMLAPTNPNLVASQAYSIGDVFAANGHLYKATAAIAQDEAIIPDTNCVETTMAEAGGKIKDVQVAGSSVVGSDGVASVSIASTSTLGVIKPRNGFGISVDGAGQIYNVKPNEAEIKTGIHQYNSIVPYNQHLAVFYGLSKVAGVDLANETVTLGTYPETSKTAIKAMLGVQDGLKVVRLI